MLWPYNERVNAIHAWGTLAAGTAGIIGLPTVLATLHASESHYSWWWPTDWMFAPIFILVLGSVLLIIPLKRSVGDKESPSKLLAKRPQIVVRQRAADVSGQMTGGRDLPRDVDVRVNQELEELQSGGIVIGYDGDSED